MAPDPQQPPGRRSWTSPTCQSRQLYSHGTGATGARCAAAAPHLHRCPRRQPVEDRPAPIRQRQPLVQDLRSEQGHRQEPRSHSSGPAADHPGLTPFHIHGEDLEPCSTCAVAPAASCLLAALLLLAHIRRLQGRARAADSPAADAHACATRASRRRPRPCPPASPRRPSPSSPSASATPSERTKKVVAEMDTFAKVKRHHLRRRGHGHHRRRGTASLTAK